MFIGQRERRYAAPKRHAYWAAGTRCVGILKSTFLNVAALFSLPQSQAEARANAGEIFRRPPLNSMDLCGLIFCVGFNQFFDFIHLAF